MDQTIGNLDSNNYLYPLYTASTYQNSKAYLQINAGACHYGFNGMEKDDEVKGQGNSYDFGARMYDSRVGRWLSLDPLAGIYSDESPYTYCRNNPIKYVDKDGQKWINVHELKIAEMQKQILDNPNDKKLIKKLNNKIFMESRKADQVNKTIATLKENDYYLWAYVEYLQVSDAKTGECIDVNVRVSASKSTDAPSDGTMATTSYSNRTLDTKSTKYCKYEGLDKDGPIESWEGDAYFAATAPINSENEVGFDITFYYNIASNDIWLANEIGDVMFRMEYPIDALHSGSDTGKDFDKYASFGTAGGYSFMVDGLYESRKLSGEGKNFDSNPYPVQNTEENYKKYSQQ